LGEKRNFAALHNKHPAQNYEETSKARGFQNREHEAKGIVGKEIERTAKRGGIPLRKNNKIIKPTATVGSVGREAAGSQEENGDPESALEKKAGIPYLQ